MRYPKFLRGGGIAVFVLVLLLAACGQSSSVTGTAGSGSISGDLGPGDGDSIYLNVLPPGSNGNSAGGVGAPVQGTPASYPPNFMDQATLYGDLSYAQQGLKAAPCNPPTDVNQHQASSQFACNYFKHQGLKPDTVVSTESVPTPYGGSATIQRDGWGVPFITAANRRDAMFGVGYALAEDRLWLMDVLRHIGRGQTTAFLGPAPQFYQVDASLAMTAGYSEDELTEMVSATTSKFGPLGALILQDLDADLAGVNAYIATLSGANAAKIPPEYLELKNGGFPPATFTRNDVVASAIFIQALFAIGGGSEVTNELLLQQLDPAFSGGATTMSTQACQLWRDLRHADDPDATRTTGQTFHQSPANLNESCPQTLPAGVAVWDKGSYQTFPGFTVNGANLSPSPGRAHAVPARLRKFRHPAPLQLAMAPYEQLRLALARAGFAFPASMSNWMAVTADHSADGHPIGIMGPQMSYFDPNLPWEFAVHSTGGSPIDFDGRGMAFGTLPYILIGRGVDYAWSATSGDGDLIDTRVSKLCNLDGSAPSLSLVNGFPKADGYLYDVGDGNGPQCRRFYKRTDSWTATPTVASLGSSGPLTPQTIKRYVLRTHYGPVFATATVQGAPVAISLQRSTYFGELDTSAPAAVASTPIVHGVSSFQHLFNGITGTFNWLYVDKQDVGYIESGLLPIRDPQQSPELPDWGDGRYEWANDRGLTADFFKQYGGDVPFPGRVQPAAQNGGPLNGGWIEWQNFLPFASHPQEVNPAKGYILSWNNSPAKGWWAADNRANWGPIHRVDTEGPRFAALLAAGRKFDFANVAEIMADAGYTDLRGQAVLPLLLQLMQQGALNADQQQVVSLMQAWLDDGSRQWIDGGKGLGAMRRDRSHSGQYDHRAAVVLMDAWDLHLRNTVSSQLAALDPAGDVPGLVYCVNSLLLCRLDAPRQQGSAFEYGWFQVEYRLLQMALNTPGHTDYQALKCAGTGALADCRQAVLSALDSALADLGGIANMAKWDGSTLPNEAGKNKAKVETYDEIQFQVLSAIADPPMPWINRPTYQQVIEVKSGR